jgi:undecaprenyl-diphosphatase
LNLLSLFILACVQGLAELLPISSSAHVILAEKLLRLDPTQPEMTLLLVMLHSGTMFAVLVYFWKDWQSHYFQSRERVAAFLKQVFLATLATGLLGGVLLLLIEKVYLRGSAHAEVESLFGNLKLISVSLATAGALILYASLYVPKEKDRKLGPAESLWIGFIQGLCLPFRGFSRSGATISTGLILGLDRRKAEEFSFALAVVLTPPVLLREIHRLDKAQAALGLPHSSLGHALLPGLLGMAFSFAAGLLALKWLSSWLEKGRWYYFGFYCLGLAGLIWFLGGR